MAALDFPASPANGQVYQNWIYSTSKGAWQAKPMVSAKTVTADVAPSNPANGDEWLNTLDGCLYIYYVDVDGGQWVQVKNDASFSSELGPTVDALNAGANTNYVINGAFDINQRSFTSTTTNGTYGFDRWLYSYAGGTSTYSAQTFTLGAAPAAGYEAANYARVATSGQSAAGDYATFQQRIEGVRTLAGQTATISFWAKAASGTPSISVDTIQNFGSATGGSANVTTLAGKVAITTSWQRYSVTVNLPSISGKTIGTSGDLLQIQFWMSGGSNWDSRTGTLGIQNNTFDFWGVQVQAGSKATAFHRAAPTLQGELAACQRYYNRYTADAADTQVAGGVIFNATGSYFQIPVPAEMRVKPTAIEYSNVSDFRVYRNGGNVTPTSVSLYSGGSTRKIIAVYMAIPTSTAGNACWVEMPTTGSYIAFSSEL